MKGVKYLLSVFVVVTFLAACEPTTVVETVPVEVPVTVVVEGKPVEVPVTVEVEGEPVEVPVEVPVTVVVEATPVPLDKSGGTFVWGVGGDPPGFNPILNNNGVEIVIFQLTSEPLTWGGENFPPDLKPILAESWDRSEDGLTWTIHLRQNVTWSDGEPFTADDVLFWAAAIQDPDTTGSRWVHGRFFVNDEPFIFEKVDDYTVTITTAAPVPTLMNNICACIIPEHYFVENNISHADMVKSDFNTTMNIGTGPFIIDEYRKGEVVILKANENAWRGRPYLDSFVFRIIPDAQSRVLALQTGEIDFTSIDPMYVPSLIGDPNIQMITTVVDMQYHFRLNVSKPMLSDKRTRQALFFALDRAALLQALKMGYGQIADSVYNPVVSAYEPLSPYDYDPAKAASLLEEVGWVMGADGVLVAESVEGVEPGTRFSLVLDSFGETEEKAMVLAQSYWAAVGVESTIRPIDENVFYDENQGKEDKPYDVYWSGIGFIGSNGANYQWLMAYDKVNSSMSYENPEVIELFGLAQTTEDEAERDAYLKQAAEIVWDDAPFLPIYYAKRVYGANKKVHFEDADWQVNMVGIFGAPEKIWIEK
jgi:peptide/nickel transport system substrate-binding protein